MDKLILTSALMVIGVTQAAWADNQASFNDKAQVVSSTPIYQQINEPRRECWTETVSSPSANNVDHNYGGAILGGLVGGLLGNTVGGGNGRTAAAAVGAVTGAMVGDKIGNNQGGYGYNQPRQVEHCTNHDNYRQIVTGYNVVYRYQGRTLNAVMPQDPGKYVDVSVNVGLANRQQDERYDKSASYY
ncbi:MAG: glycine zipper 2TM domain-containing protein [Sulfuriferula sp.]|nr:glycine zipper 2TM domain-containing protein [Sulfuriferula sp.]